jgi:hypothetical protein
LSWTQLCLHRAHVGCSYSSCVSFAYPSDIKQINKLLVFSGKYMSLVEKLTPLGSIWYNRHLERITRNSPSFSIPPSLMCPTQVSLQSDVRAGIMGTSVAERGLDSLKPVAIQKTISNGFSCAAGCCGVGCIWNAIYSFIGIHVQRSSSSCCS